MANPSSTSRPACPSVVQGGAQYVAVEPGRAPMLSTSVDRKTVRIYLAPQVPYPAGPGVDRLEGQEPWGLAWRCHVVGCARA